jgi:hypothetical protein
MEGRALPSRSLHSVYRLVAPTRVDRFEWNDVCAAVPEIYGVVAAVPELGPNHGEIELVRADVAAGKPLELAVIRKAAALLERKQRHGQVHNIAFTLYVLPTWVHTYLIF